MSDSEDTHAVVVAVGGADAAGTSGTTAAKTAAKDADMSAILNEIRESQRKLSSKFVQFRDEIKRGQEDAAEKALKRVRREKPYVYKRKGNEEQANFNEKVEEAIASAQLELEGPSTSAAIGKASSKVCCCSQSGKS